MSAECRHNRPFSTLWRRAYKQYVTVKICEWCDEWLSLGASNDSPPEVQIEIRAAEIVAFGEPHHVCNDDTNECYACGWDDLADGVAWKFDDEYHAGYLARQIATHDGESNG